MLIPILQDFFQRDLNKLKEELSLYKNENNIWRIDKQIANSAGNLCLHLVGNLNGFIGVGLARTDFTRQREMEFILKDIPRAALLEKIDATMSVVATGLSQLTEEMLNGEFPVAAGEKRTGMLYMLTHLITHLNYHLGQVNYHRRLLDE